MSSEPEPDDQEPEPGAPLPDDPVRVQQPVEVPNPIGG